MDHQQLIPLLDLTSLNNNDTDSVIYDLCQQAATPYGNVAAVCVLPKFVKLAQRLLSNTGIKIATVSNFPNGNQPLIATIAEIRQAVLAGADEVDVVMPYQAYLAGDKNSVVDFLTACKLACHTSVMKVILETGALANNNIIAAASKDAINAGADFIKTSTGKYAVGASLAAAETMLTVIRDSHRNVGFKVSGGIKTIEQAQHYVQLAQTIMGKTWVCAQNFRIGASSLLQTILTAI